MIYLAIIGAYILVGFIFASLVGRFDILGIVENGYDFILICLTWPMVSLLVGFGWAGYLLESWVMFLQNRRN